jgi:hypothetical protein
MKPAMNPALGIGKNRSRSNIKTVQQTAILNERAPLHPRFRADSAGLIRIYS